MHATYFCSLILILSVKESVQNQYRCHQAVSIPLLNAYFHFLTGSLSPINPWIVTPMLQHIPSMLTTQFLTADTQGWMTAPFNFRMIILLIGPSKIGVQMEYYLATWIQRPANGFYLIHPNNCVICGIYRSRICGILKQYLSSCSQNNLFS